MKNILVLTVAVAALVFTAVWVLGPRAESRTPGAPEPTPDGVNVDVNAAEKVNQSAQSDSMEFADVIRTPSMVGEVVFPHLEHVEDFGMECQECHHEVNAMALDIPHESYFKDFWIDCETCHGNHAEPAVEAMSCVKCHPDQQRSLNDQTLSHKVAVHTNCWDCHEVATGADASSECGMCHLGPKPDFPIE